MSRAIKRQLYRLPYRYAPRDPWYLSKNADGHQPLLWFDYENDRYVYNDPVSGTRIFNTANYAYFDGVDDYVEVPQCPVTGEFVIEIDLTPTRDGADYSNSDFRLFGTNDSRGGTYEIRTTKGASGYNFNYATGGFYATIRESDFVAGQRITYKLSFEQDGSNINVKYYLNGSLVYSTTVTGTLNHSNDVLWIGRWDSYYLPAYIHEVKIWSDVEETNLVLHHNYTGANVKNCPDGVEDLSGMGNHGTAYGRHAFSRTTTGNIINSDGNTQEILANYPRFDGGKYAENFFPYSNDNSKLTKNAITADGVTLTSSDSASYARNASAISVLPNTNYVLSFKAKGLTGGTVKYRLYDVTHTIKIEDPIDYTTTDEWELKEFEFTTPDGCTQIYVYPVYYLTSGESIDIKEIQVRSTVAPDIYISTGENARQKLISKGSGYLGEEQRTELVVRPDASNGWTGLATTDVTTLDLDALGIFKGVQVGSAGGTSNRLRDVSYSVSLTAGTTYNCSAWYMAGTSGKVMVTIYPSSSVYFQVSGNIGGSFTAATVDCTVSNIEENIVGYLGEDPIYRLTFNVTPNTTMSSTYGIGPYSTVVGENIIVLAGQIEAGAYPTSYIHADGSTVTRNADALYYYLTEALYGKKEFTIQLKVNLLSTEYALARYVFSLSDGTVANNLGVYCGSDGKIKTLISLGGTTTYKPSTTVYDPNTDITITLAYKDYDYRLYVNGVLENYSNTDQIPDVLFKLSIFGNPLGSAGVSGLMKSIAIYDHCLSEEACLRLSNE